MPELPDVEVFKKYLDATSLYQTIAEVETKSRDMLGNVTPQALRQSLTDHEIEGSKRHGKFLFLRIDDEVWLVLHFGMTGFLKYFKNGNDSSEHVRLLLKFSNGYRLAYDCKRKLGAIELTKDPQKFVEDKGLGPDALQSEFDVETFGRILEGRRGRIKSTLMNQQLMAGIGNVYSDEILFHVGIHPEAKARAIKEPMQERLFHGMKEVLQTA
ncbi:Fpg/Nei family DNA glycosylase, partial [candidate division KSB1 bacterium]|nr:Fpg/Nei family DNA glycosylase [candidate division KSB1 bacterium]NIR68488.1 Fpg/Nei family DNA glycosylase [candidate division KSB1 bacterium]NIS22502.1 Fpg/Nei family DNA glycosylase [candidate division KSB1 bacterium]NIT69346.1 Fpg/Nei family DNA glycosylase [candidate division KSB1 bacterium]NIU23007.1 Fpg/Nei family DNA glycosylase [candidate division KSB1 bacterium]